VKLRHAALAALAAALLPFACVQITEWPSNQRDWSPDQAVLARAEFDGERVTVRNVRNFEYRSVHEYAVRYETRSYDLSKLDSMWFMVERFGPHDEMTPAIAHTLLSFGFGGEYVAVSVEIRKERGESYSPWKGLLRQYELMYVVADERDVIGLRTNHRRDTVYLYPVRAPVEAMRRAFVEMLQRANQLAEAPEFYNTLTSTCTTNLVRHVNTIAPARIPPSYKVILPAYSDSLAYDLGLIPNEQPLEQVRAAHRIDALAQELGVRADFSRALRRRAGILVP
jgi:hypothetical protein